MPELPEVETIVRELQPVLTGQRLVSVEFLNKNSLVGDPLDVARKLIERSITRIFRQGKYICFALDSGWHLTIHLKMSGRLVFCPGEKDRKYLRATFSFATPCALYFIDMRKFGKIKLWPPQQPLLPELGPDPLQPDTVRQALTGIKSKRPIKSVLLDQRILSGIGNIYADESLFAARIHPLTPPVGLSAAKRQRLGREISRILYAAIGNKGTTLSDYRPPLSATGENQHTLKVYGREDLPCFSCATPIQRLKISSRSSYFCPACQKK